MLSLPRTSVQSLIWEPSSLKPCGMAKNKQTNKTLGFIEQDKVAKTIKIGIISNTQALKQKKAIGKNVPTSY